MHEIVANLHMHTPYSDGAWYHADIVAAAARAGLDVICVTDHNVWVEGLEGYREHAGRKVLMLIGEEVHNQARQPQKNHLLAYGAQAELARYAEQPQTLIDAVRAHNGLAFLAHPADPDNALLREPGLNWVDWDVDGYTGIEIWNYMTAFKRLCTSHARALRFAYDPDLGMDGPAAVTLAKWDELLAAGRRVVALGNADAHGTEYRMSGLKREIFPYEFLFTAVNTHLLLPAPLSGEVEADRRAVLAALAAGHCFVGYERPAPTRGFRFTASGAGGAVNMGDELDGARGVTFQVVLPRPAEARLVSGGREVARWQGQTHLTHVLPPGMTGAFRVEVYTPFRGRRRGWIFSNPIYLR